MQKSSLRDDVRQFLAETLDLTEFQRRVDPWWSPGDLGEAQLAYIGSDKQLYEEIGLLLAENGRPDVMPDENYVRTGLASVLDLLDPATRTRVWESVPIPAAAPA